MSTTHPEGIAGRFRVPAPKQVQRAIREVRRFIYSLRASLGKPSPDFDPQTSDFVAFSVESLGGLGLSGDEPQEYRDCLTALVALHGQNLNERPISRTATEKLLQRAILRTLRPKDDHPVTRSTFQRRLTDELRGLKRGLLVNPIEWTFAARVSGFAPSCLPFRFGGIAFAPGTRDNARNATACVESFEPASRMARAKVAQELQGRAKLRSQLEEDFSAEAIASFSVRAIDSEAAKHLGTERVRRTLDAINFFAPYFARLHPHDRVFLPPEGRRVELTWIVHQPDSGAFQSSVPTSPSPRAADSPIKIGGLSTPRATEVGMTLADTLLARPDPTDFQQRIINALSWAGRAGVEYRREQAFLLYTIALEALLTNPKSRAGVTDRLKFRAARMLGSTPDARRRIYDLVARLYDIRSALVHTGDSTDLTDSDFGILRSLVGRAITVVLTDVRFAGITTGPQFETWFDHQLFE